MSYNGVIASVTVQDAQILADDHPPIIKELQIEAEEIVVAGTIIALNQNNKHVPYDPAAVDDDGNALQSPVGVLLLQFDPTRQSAGNVLVHGAVLAKELKIADGSPPNTAILQALEAKTIWAF